MKEFISYPINKARNFDPRKLPKKQRFIISLSVIILLAITWFILFVNKPEVVLPPNANPKPAFKEVQSFIETDNTDSIRYGEGFNCFDYVLRVWRNAQWHGIAAYPIFILYKDPPYHAVIGFQTSDNGDVFYETENDNQIRLRIGKYYGDKKVTGIYLIKMSLVPLYDSPELDEMPPIK